MFKVAVAQIPSIKGNVDKNVQIHVDAIKRASDYGVSLIVFPELSLTGYEPELAETLSFTIEDRRLKPLQNLAQARNIYVAVGAPLKSKGRPEIGTLIIAPHGAITSYSKMHLHPGEEEFFQPGNEHKILEIEDHKIALAICADTNNPIHAQACSEKGASIYIAGVLITEDGYAQDTETLALYAKRYNMLVTIANHNRPTGGWGPAGKSAVWDENGNLAVASNNSNCLVISERGNGGWISEVVEM